MKRLLFILFSCISFSILAQGSINCEEITNDFSRWNKFGSEYKHKNNKKWSKAVLKEFPLNEDGSISYDYTCMVHGLDPNTLMKLSTGWVHNSFNIAKGATLEIDTTKMTITAYGQWGNVGQKIGFGATFIHAPMKVRLSFQEGKIRLQIKVEQYRMGSANLFAGKVESDLISIGKTYPADEKSKHSGEYAMAFINTNANCISMCKGYINYMEKHLNDTNFDNDW